jgi:guanine deaminase
LGSGLYKFEKAREFGITTVFGSDMGAGNWFCQLLTLDEAYKMAQLQGVSLSPYEAFYLITLGGARGLSIDDKVGNFEKGKEADFVVLDMKCTELIEYRMARTQNLFEKLFVIMMMGDDRFIKETRLMGQCAYEKKR